MLLVSGWLVWKCLRDPKINFLPGDRRAEWIIFQTAIDSRSHSIAMIDATFRRAFTLDSQAKVARLEFRAAKRLELKINGQSVSTPPMENWKPVSTSDVANLLRAGENKIEARVFNDDAPPAFWMLLTTDSLTLPTDGTWEASIAGSSSRKCAMASVPRKPGPGNLLAGGERISDAVPKAWFSWILFAILAALTAIALYPWVLKDEVDLSHRQLWLMLGCCALAWAVLFWNNARMLPFHAGYDFKDHVAYIKYIQERGALPQPNEGYEMFQPPLFYALSAALLSVFNLSTSDAAAVPALRALTMLFGIANFVFVFLSLRLLFPGRGRAQFVGLITAAFLPMQLYLSHYVTNEVFAAMLATISVYLGLRALAAETESIWQILGLGVCLGAAMLAKATTLLVIPPLLGALGIKLWQQHRSIRDWMTRFGAIIAAISLTCGWHYLRVWRHFGSPIIGNWDPSLGFGWWQDPGIHVAADYLRFGQALVAPMFSGFNGFADGIFSTLWGDSLGGGLSGVISRTPWNYSLMTGGNWLAIFPTLFVMLGIGLAIIRFYRRITPEWFLLLGLSAAVLVALVFMTIKVPSYAQVKAFYGLAALVPFCAFAVLGWQTLTGGSYILRVGITAFLIFFAINSFASVWIQSSSAQHVYNALRFSTEPQSDRAIAEAIEATKSADANANPHCILGGLFEEAGDSNKAITECERGIQLDEKSGDCHFRLGVALGKRGDLPRAMAEARRALELQPENPNASSLIFALAHELHRAQEALDAGSDAIALSPFDPSLHYRMGQAAGEIGDFTRATQHLAYASLLAPKRSDVLDKLNLALRFASQSSDAASRLREIAAIAPDSAPLLNKLAWIFATDPNSALRDSPRAIELAERACALTKRQQSGPLAIAAAAYAEAGKFEEAIAFARDAAALAQRQGDRDTAGLAEKMLTSFQANQPYREEPH